jgi:HlyD family secretion protein
MKRWLTAIGVLALLLTIALVVRVCQLRAARHGPAGGTGVIEGVSVDVTARLAARILRVEVEEGDVVARGQVLVVLDCTAAEAALVAASARLAAAQARFAASHESARSARFNAAAARDTISAAASQVGALEAQERLAAIELERQETLLRAGATTRASVDQARSRHDALLEQIAAQRASTGTARRQAHALSSAGSAAGSQAVAAEADIDAMRAEVDRARVDVGECTLVAPRRGVVVSRNFEPGELVQPGTIALSLTDASEARTRFYLPNDELAAAAPGRAVTVVADAYPGERFHGTIFYVSPEAEFTPRNVQTRKDRERLVYAVEVRIPNQDLRLRPGMPVEVTIDGSWQ